MASSAGAGVCHCKCYILVAEHNDCTLLLINCIMLLLRSSIDGGTVRLQAIIGLGRALDMILTGRAVSAQEALQFGLANRVVPKGKALEESLRIAKTLTKFPQRCMNADRMNTYYTAYSATSHEDALRKEFDEGIKVITDESVGGAAKFSQGAGRHGSFAGFDS